jgi:hypothetical protein
MNPDDYLNDDEEPRTFIPGKLQKVLPWIVVACRNCGYAGIFYCEEEDFGLKWCPRCYGRQDRVLGKYASLTEANDKEEEYNATERT